MAKFKELLTEYAEVTEQKNHLCSALIIFWSEAQIEYFVRTAEGRELVWDIIITLSHFGFDFSDYTGLDNEIEYLKDRGDI